MTLAALAAHLEARGVSVGLRLTLDAPAGAITPEVRAALAEHKPVLAARTARRLWGRQLESERWGPMLLPEGHPDRDADEPPDVLADEHARRNRPVPGVPF